MGNRLAGKGSWITARLARDGKQAGGKGKLDDSPVCLETGNRLAGKGSWMTARLSRDGKQAGGKGKLDDSPVV